MANSPRPPRHPEHQGAPHPGTPSQSTRKKAKPHPGSLVVFAVIAYLAGAPLIISVIVLIVAAFAWRKYKADQQMAKMPPLPPHSSPTPHTAQQSPRTERTAASSERAKAASAPQPSTPPVAKETSQGWTLPPLPWEAPEREGTVVEFERVPEVTVPDAEITEAIEPQQPVSRRPARAQSRVSSRAQPQTQWSNPAALRQAMVAMAVLGPCRAQAPYQGPETDFRTPSPATPPTSSVPPTRRTSPPASRH